MRFSFTLLASLLVAISSQAQELPKLPPCQTVLDDSFRFDSATSIPVECQINDLVLKTETDDDDPKTIREEIDQQLMFLQGKLNQYSSAADVGHSTVKIKRIEPREENSRLRKIVYSANTMVAWCTKWQLVDQLRMAFPARADEKGVAAFHKAFGKGCSQDPNDADLTAESFFYYYRPDKNTCPLFSKNCSQDVVSYAPLNLSRSKAQSNSKCPEYHKIHKDGKIIMTCIFGTNEVGATSNSDAGIQAYNTLYQLLRKRFQYQPTMNVNLAANACPGMAYPDVEMEWHFQDVGTINVNLLLVDKEGLVKPTKAFAAKYNQRTRHSDFVVYSGHSGYGENIRALTNMGTFEPGQWQLFYINGCVSYAYIDDSLRAAHQKANPGSKPYEYFNIITNSMPSTFAGGPASCMSILEGMLFKNRTYRQILGQFESCQCANVTGEEDNEFVLKGF